MTRLKSDLETQFTNLYRLKVNSDSLRILRNKIKAQRFENYHQVSVNGDTTWANKVIVCSYFTFDPEEVRKLFNIEVPESSATDKAKPIYCMACAKNRKVFIYTHGSNGYQNHAQHVRSNHPDYMAVCSAFLLSLNGTNHSNQL